jgi:benzylsuccinate CoA-transferase BbsE subunit
VSRAALAGLSVVDLSDDSCRYAARLLAGLGADVVRIHDVDERTGGTREHWDAYMSAGTRSVGDGRSWQAWCGELAPTADVVLVGGVVPAEEIHRLRLRDARPSLVVCTVTPFGRTGPRRRWRGDDLIAWATGGLAYTCGDPDRPPVAPAPDVQLAHALSSQYAVIGILGAVRQARQTGRGQDIDISVQDCVVAISGETGPLLWLDDLIMRRRVGNRRQLSAPFGQYPARDGYVSIVAGMPAHWDAMAAWIVERTGNEGALDPSLRGGPQSRTGGAWDVVNLFTEELTRTYRKQEFFEEAQRRGIPAAPVNTVASVAADPQLEERGFWARQRMPDGRYVRVPGAPFLMSATPWRCGDPPAGVAHTLEVLRGSFAQHAP